jgi:hypothetical protein
VEKKQAFGSMCSLRPAIGSEPIPLSVSTLDPQIDPVFRQQFVQLSVKWVALRTDELSVITNNDRRLRRPIAIGFALRRSQNSRPPTG